MALTYPGIAWTLNLVCCTPGEQQVLTGGECCIIQAGWCLPEPTWDQQRLHLPSPPTPKHPNNLPYIARPLQPGLGDVLLALKEELS